MLIIVDYGVGNLASIKNMLKKVGIDSIISSSMEEIGAAEKLILPGVGHFDNCMKMFNASGLREMVTKKVFEEKTPVLGICVGCQMLLETSEEGTEKGLGWVRGTVVKFDQSRLGPGNKIPHMGWTEVILKKHSPLFENMYEEPRFYFVHSYHPQLTNKEDVLLEADYGYPFDAAIEHENILGVQFHPEKSHKFGMRLLENFVKNY
jgi:imidazole glycerol-phosphate synthase subunit HisH